MGSSGWLSIDVEVLRVSEKAVLCRFRETTGFMRDLWFPRTVLDEGDVIDESFDSILVKEWFYEKEGIET
jgi:hypothetical protein